MTGRGVPVPPRNQLHLSGQLSVQLDSSPVEIRGEGSELRVVAADVASFLNRVSEAVTGADGALPGRRDLGLVAGKLADRGVTVRVGSTTHPVLVLGAGVDSRLGGAVLGTRRARPAGVAALTATDQGRWALLTAAAVAVAAAVALLRRAR